MEISKARRLVKLHDEMTSSQEAVRRISKAIEFILSTKEPTEMTLNMPTGDQQAPKFILDQTEEIYEKRNEALGMLQQMGVGMASEMELGYVWRVDVHPKVLVTMLNSAMKYYNAKIRNIKKQIKEIEP